MKTETLEDFIFKPGQNLAGRRLTRQISMSFKSLVGVSFLACLLSLAQAAESGRRPELQRALSPAAARPVPGPKLEPASSSMDALDDKHRLAIGDRLSFRVLEDQEDPKEPTEPKSLTVTDAGDLEVPYLGRVPAENRTCKQLAREIKAALEKEYYYQATVIIAVDLMTKTRGKIYVVGPVHVPGPQEIPSDEILTLSKAIMRAGGFDDTADKRNVKVIRKNARGDGDKKSNLIVDVEEIFDKGRVDRDLPLEPGDFIVIPTRLIRF